MTRDGLGNFISTKDFKKYYELCLVTPTCKAHATFIKESGDSIIMDIIGIGELSEHISYAGEYVLFNIQLGKLPYYILPPPCPLQLVYKGIIKQ